jgi:hypothetical protein
MGKHKLVLAINAGLVGGSIVMSGISVLLFYELATGQSGG